jgi:hypothetical protein
MTPANSLVEPVETGLFGGEFAGFDRDFGQGFDKLNQRRLMKKLKRLIRARCRTTLWLTMRRSG